MSRTKAGCLAIGLACIVCSATSRGATCEGMNGSPGDLDGDGFSGAFDCDDHDAALWSAPGDVTGLGVPAGNRHVLVWDAVEDPGGSSGEVAYDVLRSQQAANFDSDPSAVCIDPSGLDLQAIDTTVPPPDGIFFYLVRARNECGPGSLGSRSDGTPRLGRDCDCAQLCDDGDDCTVDGCGNGLCLHEAAPPELLRQPKATAACHGGSARFWVVAQGTGALSYQWRKNGLPVGVNSPLLTLSGLSAAGDHGASITLDVTDGCGTLTSETAALTVFANPASCAGGLDGQEAPNGASFTGYNGVGNAFDRFDTFASLHPNSGDFDEGTVYQVGLHLHSGELKLRATDLSIPGRGFDFAWTRIYRSREWRSTSMGVGWTHGYDRRIEADRLHPGQILVHGGDSRIDSFAPLGNGCLGAAGFFEELCPKLGGIRVLTFPDKTTWTFAKLDGSPAAGRITKASDRYGNTMSFAYDPVGRLTTITDTLGRAITVGYNARNLVATVTDFTGRVVSYEYYDGLELGGELDDLESATSPAVVGTPTGNDFPDGKTTVYTYSQGFAIGQLNHNLLSVTDPEGNTFLELAYSTTDDLADPSFDRVYCFEPTLNDSDPELDELCFTYVPQLPSPANGSAVSKTIVNDGMGNVGEYLYDAQARLVRARQYTGRAPDPGGFTDDTLNRPTGQLRPEDPPVYETQYEYNADSLVTHAVYPEGNEVLLVYDEDNANPRKRGDIVQETYLPGPLGGDQPAIVDSWSYEPDLGTSWGGRGEVARSNNHVFADENYSFTVLPSLPAPTPSVPSPSPPGPTPRSVPQQVQDGGEAAGTRTPDRSRAAPQPQPGGQVGPDPGGRVGEPPQPKPQQPTGPGAARGGAEAPPPKPQQTPPQPDRGPKAGGSPRIPGADARSPGDPNPRPSEPSPPPQQVEPRRPARPDRPSTGADPGSGGCEPQPKAAGAGTTGGNRGR